MSKAASDNLEKVCAEFEAEAVADLDAGRKEAMSKIEATRKETAEAVTKVLETSSKQAEAIRRQIIGSAELEARNGQLRALDAAVNRAFEDASKMVSDSSGTEYENALVKLLQEGLEVIGGGAKVRCASKDKRAVASAIKKLESKAKATLDEDPVETIGGVVLTTSDGAVRFDNTFEARLERMRPELRREIAAILTAS